MLTCVISLVGITQQVCKKKAFQKERKEKKAGVKELPAAASAGAFTDTNISFLNFYIFDALKLHK